MNRIILWGAGSSLALTLVACGGDAPAPAQSADAQPAPAPAEEVVEVHEKVGGLDAVLAAQPAEAQARYQFRNPKETLEFFGIEPGMKVMEALPGGGWYSKILLPYLGAEGELVGVDYTVDMFPLFGFFSDEAIEGKKVWTQTWPAEAEAWRGDAGASISAYNFGSVDASEDGTVDAVLFVRALHNLNRFEPQGGYLSTALADAHRVLKPGGVVGVVQHQAPDDAADEWADGSRGYLKKANLIAKMEAAGFEFVAESGVNHNHKDQPGENDIVWRLPPSLVTSREDPALREQLTQVGESNRMTLLFRKAG